MARMSSEDENRYPEMAEISDLAGLDLNFSLFDGVSSPLIHLSRFFPPFTLFSRTPSPIRYYREGRKQAHCARAAAHRDEGAGSR